jgi:hypothetical protein
LDDSIFFVLITRAKVSVALWHFHDFWEAGIMIIIRWKYEEHHPC